MTAAGSAPMPTSQRGHHGLANMRARAAGLGGTLDIESEAGEGTRIIVVIPRSGAGEEEAIDV